MYKLVLEDVKGNQLTFGMGGAYTISEIEGLAPPKANINLSDMALMDGQHYNSAKVETRTLNIAFAIETDAEQNRLNAYRVLRIKQPIRMYYSSDLRDVYIDGYISEIGVTHFAMKQIVTVSIICPSPYFKSAQEVVNELSAIVSGFHFPFAITEENPIPFSFVQMLSNVTVENLGEVDTGLIIIMYATDTVTNPKIFDYETQDYFGINYTLQAGDQVTINTMSGEKTVTLLRDGEETNLFNYVMEGSKWIQLDGISKSFVYEVGSGSIGDLSVQFKHFNLYQGV